MRRRAAQAVRHDRGHVQRQRLLPHGLTLGRCESTFGLVRFSVEVRCRFDVRLRIEVGLGIERGWRIVVVFVRIDIVGIDIVGIDIGNEILARLDGFVNRAPVPAVRSIA